MTLDFEVEDTGPGIPPEEIDTIFDAFIQSRSHHHDGGTGLGLAISRRFTQLLGGDIRASSVLSQGTRFTVHLQATLADPADVAESAHHRRVVGLAPGQPNYRILVVDDQPDNRRVVRTLLEQVGFSVKEAVNGADAIATTTTWPPHLIWMDMRMPVMDGYEATRQLKAQPRPPIIIALTASVFEEKREAVRAAGCDDFVSKPFQEHVIFDKLAEFLGVRYRYAAPETAGDETPPLTAADLAVMPPEWLESLARAAIQADALLLQEHIGQVPPHCADLIGGLTAAMNGYDYDTIIEQVNACLSQPLPSQVQRS